MLIQMAYDVRPEQVSGGPGWTDSEEYTVIAKGPEEALFYGKRQLELTGRRRPTSRLYLPFEAEAG
jgi:uncharacterized protein (TIGR03435 family)